MKNLFLTLAVAAMIFAFNNTADAQVRVEAPDGNTCVGCTGATEKLQVEGNIKATGGSSPISVDVGKDRTALGQARFDFYADDATNFTLRLTSLSNGSSSFRHTGVGNFLFRTDDAASNLAFRVAGANPAMVVRADGSTVEFMTPDIQVNGMVYSSDARLKQNVVDYSVGLDAVMALNPITYEYNGKGNTVAGSEHVGIIAQDLQRVAPELVVDRSHLIWNEKSEVVGQENYLAVKGNEIQFILINAIQEQQAQIEALQAQLGTQGGVGQGTVPVSNSIAVLLQGNQDQAILGQNVPNPFTNNTKVEYFVPAKAQSAQIIFTDINGNQMKAINVDHTGMGVIDVAVKDLSTGIYSYTLIVDGEAKATKKMIIE